MDLKEFIINFSEEYTVQHIDDAHEGIFIDKIKEDIWLIRNLEK